MHPNPAHHDLFISPGIEYSIFNMKGKVWMEGISTIEPLDISKLSIGMYYVRMKSDKQVIVRKIFKI